MAGRGGVVTSAGFVFAATMAAMMGSKLIILAQMGSTIALRLLADTLIVPSLLMPSIATLLGRWFWWPQIVYPAVTITSGNRNLNVRQGRPGHGQTGPKVQNRQPNRHIADWRPRSSITP